MAGLKAIIGDTVTGKDGKEVSVDTLADAIVGLYFSAHWCPPCRGFTPVLTEFYNKLKAQGKNFEVIFLSGDRDQKSYDEYYGSMPWLTLGFGSDRKDDLSAKYSVKGIPCLILLKGGTGELITKDGRAKVTEDPNGNSFPWTA